MQYPARAFARLPLPVPFSTPVCAALRLSGHGRIASCRAPDPPGPGPRRRSPTLRLSKSPSSWHLLEIGLYALRALGRAERSGSVELNRKNINRKEIRPNSKRIREVGGVNSRGVEPGSWHWNRFLAKRGEAKNEKVGPNQADSRGADGVSPHRRKGCARDPGQGGISACRRDELRRARWRDPDDLVRQGAEGRQHSPQSQSCGDGRD